MIDIEPTNRPTFDSLLHNARGAVFPETFYSFLHNWVASTNEHSMSIFSSAPVPTPAPSATTTPINAKAATSGPSLGSSDNILGEPLPSDSDHRMERIWSDYENIEPYLLQSYETDTLDETLKEPVKIEYGTTQETGKPFQVKISLFSLPSFQC
jgi:phosphoinositide-3-kinase, regulatory subunit 4